jgi:hypothetical protein
MFPVSRKVGIQGQDAVIIMDFRHADDTSIQRQSGCRNIFAAICSNRSKKATSGPVSTMDRIAPEAL